MAWIESHQALERHYKTVELAFSLGWTLDETIGKLHRFWWWCVDYAEDGDLRKHDSQRLGSAVGLTGDDAVRFVENMIRTGWLDKKPYFRTHDWWEYIGRFLQVKYKHKPEKWKKIKELCESKNNRSNNRSDNGSDNHKPTNLTNHKKEVQTDGLVLERFQFFWKAYPRKEARPRAEKAWLKIDPDEALLKIMLEKIEQFKNTEQWKKEKGQFIPLPATWLNQRRWEDEIGQVVKDWRMV